MTITTQPLSPSAPPNADATTNQPTAVDPGQASQHQVEIPVQGVCPDQFARVRDVFV